MPGQKHSGFELEAGENITMPGVETVDGIDVSTHDVATTGVHGVDTGTIARVTNGSYTGDNTANRAIAHGLGAAPALVILMDTAGSNRHFLLVIDGGNHLFCEGGATAVTLVTFMNATNFYVGNAASFVNTANANTNAYKWVAFA